jgi:Ice-binding-like
MKNINVLFKVFFALFAVLLISASIIGCSNNPTGGGNPGISDNSKGSAQGVIPGSGQLNPASGGPAAIDLGTAGNFAILAASGITTTGTTHVYGDLGISPKAASFITGFALTLHSTYATSSLVTGKVYASDYAAPTPTYVGTAVSDMMTAYVDGGGRTNPTATELGAGDISGMTLVPGLYKWGTGVLINGSVTLSGGPNSVWIFQIAQKLTVGDGARIILSGGAQPKNIFWVVTGLTHIGTTASFYGNILCATQINVLTGATITGRALAQTQVTLQANQVTQP